MDKRSFLTSLLGVSAAPAIVKASSLMPIWTPKHYLWRLPSKNDVPLLLAMLDKRIPEKDVIDLHTGKPFKRPERGGAPMKFFGSDGHKVWIIPPAFGNQSYTWQF